MEIRHFKELIGPLSGWTSDFTSMEREQPPELQTLAHEIAEKLDRFGYIVNPVRLMVRIDPSCYDPVLTRQQEQEMMNDLEYLYRRLGI